MSDEERYRHLAWWCEASGKAADQLRYLLERHDSALACVVTCHGWLDEAGVRRVSGDDGPESLRLRVESLAKDLAEQKATNLALAERLAACSAVWSKRPRRRWRTWPGFASNRGSR